MSYLRRLTACAGVLSIAMCVVSTGTAQAAPAWTFLGNNAHTSYVPDPAFSTGNASTMGLKWMANLFSTDLGSPVVAYNPALSRTVLYVGNERSDVFALDPSTGKILWSTNVGYNTKLRATPAVAPDGSVWVGTNFSATLYKLDPATGKVLCSAKSLDGLAIMGSPMIVTPSGSTPKVYWDSIDGTPETVNGPIVSTNVSDCSQSFAFYGYRGHAGPWTTPAYGVIPSGRQLVVVGTADTDSTIYAIDAVSGASVWNFPTYNPGDYDVGDAATIGAPGKNGFANGAVYVNNKFGIEYGLDLATGSQLWQYSIYPAGFTGLHNTISSAALDGNALVFGYANGLISLNPSSGALNWQVATPAEVASSPAIAGAPGSEVVAFGDYTGAFRLVSLAAGSSLYSYQTHGYITSSPAIYNGTAYIASSDGFLYAFAPNGTNAAAPATAIGSPGINTQIGNPNGSITVAGSSTDATGVARVEVAVQSGGASGQWYNGTTNSFQAAPWRNAATVTVNGSNATWKYSFPVPASGGSYQVIANTVNTSGVTDHGASIAFSVKPSLSEPTLHTSSFDVQPASTFTATGNAFKPGETVTFSLLGATVATATVGTTGNVPRTAIAVPATAAFGPTSLTATGNVSGKVSSATVFVTNEWTQRGYSGARAANEPNDPVIAQTIDVGKNTILQQSWTVATGAPVNSSPAIVNGVAYVGNDAGTLLAVKVSTGSPAWKYTIPTHAPIKGSPAVDSAGNIYFGADDGVLYELSSAGALIRTITLGGKIQPPAIDADQLIVANDAGTIFAISDSTGATSWSASAGSGVHAPPTYDAANGLVIVGNDAGGVTAFASATGAVRWTAATGGAIVSPIAVYNKNVYVGSGDGKLHTYKEITGASSWVFQADGAITSDIIVGGATNITFGTNKGSVWQVTPAGAKVFWQAGRYGNTPIVGMAGASQNAFGTTTGGLISSTREEGTSTLNPWTFQSGGAMTAAPAILNGTLYFGSQDGNLYAYSPNGAAPMIGVQRIGGGALVRVTSDWTCTSEQ